MLSVARVPWPAVRVPWKNEAEKVASRKLKVEREAWGETPRPVRKLRQTREWKTARFVVGRASGEVDKNSGYPPPTVVMKRVRNELIPKELRAARGAKEYGSL